jgi:hypothetical protein
MLFIHKLFIYFKIKRELKKLLPPWWCIKSIELLSIHKKTKYLVSPPGIKLQVDFKIKEGNPSWCINKEVTVTNFGKVIDGLDNLDIEVRISDDIKKKYKRNSILEELGI